MKCYFLLIFLFFPSLIWAQGSIDIASVSSNFISIINEDVDNQTIIALYGNNFDDLLFDSSYQIYLGTALGKNITGNNNEINVTFTYPENLTTSGIYYLKILQNNETIYESDIPIEIFNPYLETYENSHTKKYYKNKKFKKISKKNIGLNAHQTLASNDSTDTIYDSKLLNSNTKWVREHFSHELIMSNDQAAWVTRYDQILNNYKKNNLHVVAMLAYDLNNDYTYPSEGAYANFVRFVLKRYRNYVDVWEIWNEPDSTTYLKPNTIAEYLPLLKYASGLIRYYDPSALILNGGIADITNTDYINKLYHFGHDYFDAFNIHLYFCDEYQFNNNINAEREAIENMEKIIFHGKRNKPVWVTEIGCSTYHNKFNQNTQKNYLKKSINYLSTKKYLQNILLYTMRDRNLTDTYESKFGLMTENFINKKAWTWYRKIPKS